MFDANLRVYGVRKVWRQLQRESFDVARCTVARLMKAMGLERISPAPQLRCLSSLKGREESTEAPSNQCDHISGHIVRFPRRG